MIRKILVALDGSERAAHVVVAADEIAVRFGAGLIPFRAVTVPPEFPPAAHVASGDPLPAYLESTAEKEVRALLNELGVRHEPAVIGRGAPWRAILRAADMHDVDLIVIGSHGYNAVDRILGTTAARVANMAERNILVVHTRIARSVDDGLAPSLAKP